MRLKLTINGSIQLSPEYLIVGVIVYVVSIIIFIPSGAENQVKSHKVRKIDNAEKLMLIHNLLLAIFSGITFINTVPIIDLMMEYVKLSILIIIRFKRIISWILELFILCK